MCGILDFTALIAILYCSHDAAKAFDLINSEIPEYIGRAVYALAADTNVSRWNGQVVVDAELAREYGFTDIDGQQPKPLTCSSY